MGNDKIKIYQPKLAPSYPHPLTGDLATICINREWLPLLQGLLHPLRWKSAIWQGTPEEVDTMHQYIEDLLAVLGDDENCAMACDQIEDLRLVNGVLQKKLCGSPDWITVGSTKQILNVSSYGIMNIDVNGDGIADTNVNINTAITQLYGSREAVTDADRLCRAAWQLSNLFCDDFADLMKTAEVASGLIAQVGQAILDWLIVTFVADDTVELITEGLVLAVFEWLVTQARDPETHKKVAAMLYCSLVDNYPDDLDNVLNDIDLGALAPIFEVDTVPRIVKWLNFGEWAQTAYDTLNGDMVPKLIIGLMRSYILEIIEFSGIVQPWGAIMQRALSSAEYFDSRDCLDFPCAGWTQEFDFFTESQSAWFHDLQPFSQTSSIWVNGSGWEGQTVQIEAGDNDQNALLNYIQLEAGQAFNLLSVAVHYVINNWAGNENMTGEPLGIRQLLGGSLESIGGSLSPFTNGNGLFISEWNGDVAVDNLVFSFYGGFKYVPALPNGSFVYRKIVITGSGENPFAV